MDFGKIQLGSPYSNTKPKISTRKPLIRVDLYSGDTYNFYLTFGLIHCFRSRDGLWTTSTSTLLSLTME